MRRGGTWLALVAAALAALLSAPAFASSFSDVPDDHWAYEALDYLQESGLVEGYPDGTFKGERPFTRYEMAMVIARIFTKIQDWQAAEGAGEALPSEGEIEMSEVYARLDRLSDEFRDELSDMGARLTAVEDEQERMRGEINDIRGLIKDSGLSGSARWRFGDYLSTGADGEDHDLGFESVYRLKYDFKPDPRVDFKLGLLATELEGPAGTGFIPGSNNEQGSTNPSAPPFFLRNSGSSFIIDEAYFDYCWSGAPSILGDTPRLRGGRQYFSQGEFGLAGDNGYRSNFGLRFDTDYGNEVGAYAGVYRAESLSKVAPFDNTDPNAFQSSGLTLEGDDMLLMGLEYHSGEGTVPGHDYKLVARMDFAPNMYGSEQYLSLSGNAELPWFGDTWLNGIRGEWVYVPQNVSGLDPSGDLGLNNYSWIIEADIYNDGQSRVSLAGAQIAQIEGLPAYGNVDNDPFSEWDFTINQVQDAWNLSREGRNYFPSDFSGIGLQAEHKFGGGLNALLSWYSGQRINAAATERPGLFRLRLSMPVTNNSQAALDIITSGEVSGLESPITLVRGEYEVRF